LLLALRLFKTGNIGTDQVKCWFHNKPIWEEVITNFDCKVPPSVDRVPYVIDSKEVDEGVLQGFCEQVSRILGEVHDRRVDIACENFMIAYTKGYGDRVEGLIRGLQALFLKRDDPSRLLSRRVSRLLSSNKEELSTIEQAVRDSYGLRSRLSHGNISQSCAESMAVQNLLSLEQYLRESIFYFMALGRTRDLDDVVGQIDNEGKGFDDMKKIRLEANYLFWKGCRRPWRAGDKNVVPVLYVSE